MDKFAVRPGYGSNGLLIEFLGPLGAKNNDLGRRLLMLFEVKGFAKSQKPESVIAEEFQLGFTCTQGNFWLVDEFGGVFIESHTKDNSLIECIANFLSKNGFERTQVDFSKYK